MSNSFEELRSALKATNYPLFRDKAPKGTKYPYLVYSFVSQGKKIASGSIYRKLPLYQVSLFSTGTEKDLEQVENALNGSNIPYKDFASMQGDENDDTITHFYTYVRCVENGE
jgi:flagellar biosynthesis/type III secretory pathway M-ring protein FliF/YscJ